jgi:hypothetical protein
MRVTTGLLAIVACAFAQDTDVARLVHDLRGDTDEQIRALRALAELGKRAEPAAPAVVEALVRTADARVEEEALRALRAMGDAALDAVLVLRYDPKVPDYVFALGEGNLPALVRRLEEVTDFMPREGLDRVVARFGSAALPYLRPLVERGHAGAASAVASMEPACAAILIPELRAGMKRVRFGTSAFAIALARAGAPERLDLLRAELRDTPASRDVFRAVQEIGAGARSLADEVRACLPAQPLEAARTLWAIEHDAAPLLPHLARLLLKDDLMSMDRDDVMEFVAEMGPAAAPLSPILMSLAAQWRRKARETLRAVGTDPAALPRILLWLETGQDVARRLAMEALDELALEHAPEVARAIVAMLAAADADRRASLEPMLVTALREVDLTGFVRVVDAIGHVDAGAAAAVPLLRKAYPVVIDRGRAHVLWAFSQIGPRAAAAKPEILLALESADPLVQKCGALAVRGVLTPEEAREALPALEVIFRRSEPFPWHAVAEAMLHADREKAQGLVTEKAVAMLNGSERSLDGAALVMLGSCGRFAAAHATFAARWMKDDRGAVRALAAAAHYFLTGKKEEPLRVIAGVLTEEDLAHRVAAADAAGWIGAAAASLRPQVEAVSREELDPAQARIVAVALERLTD